MTDITNIYRKAVRVIRSCVTVAHLMTAKQYVKLIRKLINKSNISLETRQYVINTLSKLLKQQLTRVVHNEVNSPAID